MLEDSNAHSHCCEDLNLEWFKLASNMDQWWDFGNTVERLSEPHKRSVTGVLRIVTCAHVLYRSYIMQCKVCFASLTLCILEAPKMEFNNT